MSDASQGFIRRYWPPAAFFVYLVSWAALAFLVPAGVERVPVSIAGPGGRPCLATVWTPESPKAVMILGHGVTSNSSVMALAANTFARNGYIAVTIDFWGHGRSRERFDWSSNPGQVKAWVDWARARYPGMPLAYLGHSMGGEAGDKAFRETPGVDAFVSMGMLPQQAPACKTLLAFGRFEQLFSEEQARAAADGKADIRIGPASGHSLEPADRVLLQGIVAWTNNALGVSGPVVFPWARALIQMVSIMLGGVAAFTLMQRAAGSFSPSAAERDMRPADPPGRCNPFRLAAWIFRCRGEAVPPRLGGLLSAVTRGAIAGCTLVALLSWLLCEQVYTCYPAHPERFFLWLVLSPLMALAFLGTSRMLERFPLTSAFRRFAVGALARCVPLLLLALVLHLIGPGIAFAGMTFGILALVFALISAVYAVTVQGTEDFRSGAVACGVVLAWIFAYWCPLIWA